jgi:protoporphyrinogen oxidase
VTADAFIYGRDDAYATALAQAGPDVRVVVIGGGLAGLVAALDLAEAGADVVVLEAGDRFGGQIRTTRERGFLIEEGAEGFTPAQSGVRGLLRDLRLEDEVIAPDPLPDLVLDVPGCVHPESTPLPTVPPLTLRSGMAALVQAMTRRLERKADLRIGNTAVALTRTRPGWTIYPELGAALVVDAVVLALPARPAAWLVHPLSPDTGRALAALGTRPVVTVSAAYRRAAVRHPLTAAGYSSPREPGGDGIERCAFVSSVLRGRAPADWALLRTVMRPARGELIGTTDEGWAEVVHEILRPALGLREPPAAVWVARWADALPVVGSRYASLVAEARTNLRALGRIEIAGAAYEGEGLDAALTSGRGAARRLLAE